MLESNKLELNRETQFLSHLKNIVDIGRENQANIVVVGGIALRASMNQTVQFQRPNGTVPDIDMVGLGPNPDILRQTKSRISKYCHQNHGCPSASLELARFSNLPKNRYSPVEFLSGLRRDGNGEYYLTFRSIDQQIPYITMDVIYRHYGSVEIPTLPQETTLHRYETRMGYVKSKDSEKIEKFREHIQETGGDGFNFKLYQSYYDFCQKINNNHKLTIGITKLYWDLDYKLNGKISGANGFIYNLTQFFRR